MKILNIGPRPFTVTTARQLLLDIQGRRTINFEQKDKKRSRKTNLEILRLFSLFINSPGIEEILLWYKSQNGLLFIYRDAITKRLKFFGCNKYMDHHASNIEWLVKPLLHQMLHHNATKQFLIDHHSLSLVGFGFMPLYAKEECGNNYQGFSTTETCNVLSYQVNLTAEQVTMAREILRMIKRGE